MRLRWPALIAAVLLASRLVAACGGGGDAPGPTPDAGIDAPAPDARADQQAKDASPVDSAVDVVPEADAGTDSPLFDDGGACTNLTNSGPTVMETQVAMPAPTPRGGPVASGLYFLTALTIYTGTGGAVGPTGLTDQETWVYTSTNFQGIVAFNGIPSGTFGMDYTTVSTTINFTAACPPKPDFSALYTANAAIMEIFAMNGVNTEVYHYTKQ